MNTSAPAEHPIADPMSHLSAGPKRKRQNPLLKLSITRRLALGLLFPMLAIFAGLGSIGFQSNQLLEDNTNFNQHLLNASTSLTAEINTLEEIHTNTLGIINDASRTQTTQETLQEDQGSIKNLSAEYDLMLHTYLQHDTPNVDPTLLALLKQSGHDTTIDTLQTQEKDFLSAWENYKQNINETINTLTTGKRGTQPIDVFEEEQTYADVMSSNMTLLQTTDELAPIIHDATMIEENQLLLVMGLSVLCFLLGCASMGWLITTTLVRRLWRFRAATQSIEKGNFDARLEVEGRDEITMVATAVNTSLDTIVGLLEETKQQRDELARGKELKRLHAVLQEEKQALKEANDRLEALATTDMLTSLPNHRALHSLMESECERARRFNYPLSLLFFDGDRFKNVNDTYGHSIGDIVLKELGARSKSVLRAGDTIGRFGGEEFLVLLPETDTQEAWQVAERLRNIVATSPMATEEVPGGIAITVSIGLANYPANGKNIHEIRERADQAMYWAKRLGRNQIRTSEEAIRAERDATLKAATSHALQRKELYDAATQEGGISRNIIRMEQLELIYSLMGVLDVREPGMSEHAHAVSDLVSAMARRLNFEQERAFQASTAAFLHDIGKIALPDHILQKPGYKFSEQEWLLMHQHAELGAEIVASSSWLSDLAPAIRHHHERWDGHGTPEGLKGEVIPLEARMISIAEAYHAMISDRPYKARQTIPEALQELQKRAGSQFDPILVPILIEIINEDEKGTIEKRTNSDLFTQV